MDHSIFSHFFRASAARPHPDLTFQKISVVTRSVKAYRRAMEMLRKGDHSLHGTRQLRSVLEQDKLVPGSVNRGSFPGVKEVYFGEKLPPFPYMRRGTPGIAIPTKKILDQKGPIPKELAHHSSEMQEMVGRPRVVREAQWLAGGRDTERSGVAVNWVQTPHPVPLGAKDTLVASKGVLSSVAGDVRRLRLRTIPEDTFYAALKDTHPASSRVY